MVGKPWFSAVLTGLRKLRDIRDRGVDKFESLESLMSFNLGSAPDGATITQLMCANVGNTKSCSQWGVKTCAQCHLVKYCSEKCKLHHWSKHRPRCTHPYLSKNWQPAWVVEGREPIFLHPFNSVILYRLSHDMWGNVPAMDCLQIKNNEEQSGAFDDLKLCFPASADIRDMIRTVNSLPHNFTGYCDILLNDTNPILLNRTLVILFILLSSGPSLEEAAEFCTHLLYSAALPGAGAAYVKRCVDFIYGGGGEHEADLSFQRSLDTRGEGKLYSVQPSTGIKRLLEMCQSSYPLATALKGMREITLSPDQLDFREKYYATLKPAHRMSFHRFQETGILVPFAHNTVNFTEPNRFLFTSQGEWLVPEDANPLFGWDVTGVKYSGLKYGVDPDSDILGCLFFHVKHELREFAKRVRDFRIDIHVTSFDAGLLAKGISVGALPAFADATFDRVVAANLADTIGIKTCLTDWAPLLNRENRFSSILMQTSAWQTHWYPNSSVKTQWGPQTIHVLLEKYNRVSGLVDLPLTLLTSAYQAQDVQMKAVFTQGLRSPALLRVFESLDACHDNESIFQEYLDDQDVDRSAAAFDLQQRTTHRVYPKRFGIPVEATHAPKPDLSNDEFYDLFTLGGAQLSMRFLEFEGCSPRYRAISEYNDLCRRLFV
ncbi:DUF4470 domain-containing protein [Mycena indigotica]|uniref:DUF4470 domain-containing protein n=1 Tax=Mycena indigotica TaxID=2126181 RepID=A0A8H6T2Z6_9AGAR|nr:DUF4470 domain-containing protein [Mycena indigotica]KAF7309412.1 DUF4470 domain-containing protein [Mycena indigotica]